MRDAQEMQCRITKKRSFGMTNKWRQFHNNGTITRPGSPYIGQDLAKEEAA
jgi:hypothetical protein